MQAAFAQMGPQGAALAGQLTDAVRSALASAVTDVFLIGLVGTLLALAVTAFLKEAPLDGGRKALRGPRVAEQNDGQSS